MQLKDTERHGFHCVVVVVVVVFFFFHFFPFGETPLKKKKMPTEKRKMEQYFRIFLGLYTSSREQIHFK